MKNRAYILIALVTCIAFNIHSLKGMLYQSTLKDVVTEKFTHESKNLIREIGVLKKNKRNLVEEIRICNGVNIGLGVAGLAGGIGGAIGLFFKDKVIEVTGIVVSTVASALFITTNCMQCCQNPIDNDEEGYGDL